ncbi:hypothetical protein [Paraburkholderia caffeinilytica]|uniref:hypothetical protein n=1 Tax=Paraburkholderia caffeinilytica TaxID=1761016 RepID=UPI0038BB53E7
MSNHSPAETLAVASTSQNTEQVSAQLIAPAAPFITGPYDPAKHPSGPRIRRAKDSTNTRALVPPRDHEPYVRLYASNVDALGLLGSVVFDYIADWYQPNVKTGKAKLKARDCHGGYWVACSYDDLKEHTGLKKRDAERGIADCVEAGVFETTVMKFDGKRMLHIRITAAGGQPTLKGPLIVGSTAGQTPKHTGVLKNDSQAPMCALLGDQSTPVCFPYTSPISSSPILVTSLDSAAASPATKPEPVNSPEQAGKVNPKVKSDTPTPDAVASAPKFDNSLLSNGKRPLTFAREWQQLLKEQGKLVTLTRIEGRLLSIARNKLYEAGVEGGFTPSEILRLVLEKWVHFACHARDETQSGFAKLEPEVAYFTKYLSSAISFRTKKLTEQAADEAQKAAMIMANAEIEALQAAKAAEPPKPKKKSKIAQLVADEAAAKAAQQPVHQPAPAVGLSFEEAFALVNQAATPAVDAYQEADMPAPAEPAAEPAVCPAIVHQVKETTPLHVLDADEYEVGAWHEPTPEQIRAWMATATKPAHVNPNKLYNVK